MYLQNDKYSPGEVVRTTATTTMALPTAETSVCWSCNEASSFDDCADRGFFQTCRENQMSCILELRRYKDKERISTGCINANVRTTFYQGL